MGCKLAFGRSVPSRHSAPASSRRAGSLDVCQPRQKRVQKPSRRGSLDLPVSAPIGFQPAKRLAILHLSPLRARTWLPPRSPDVGARCGMARRQQDRHFYILGHAPTLDRDHASAPRSVRNRDLDLDGSADSDPPRAGTPDRNGGRQDLGQQDLRRDAWSGVRQCCVAIGLVGALYIPIR